MLAGYISMAQDQWVSRLAKVGRRFTISSASGESRRAYDDSGKEVAVESEFLEPTCCQYDPGFKPPE